MERGRAALGAIIAAEVVLGSLTVLAVPARGALSTRPGAGPVASPSLAGVDVAAAPPGATTAASPSAPAAAPCQDQQVRVTATRLPLRSATLRMGLSRRTTRAVHSGREYT